MTHGLDAALQGLDALDLGNHPVGDGAVGDQTPSLVDRELLDQVLGTVEHTRHVGEENEALRPQRAGDGAEEAPALTFKVPPFAAAATGAMHAEDSLFILYTSGSTGKPKGVLHTTGGYLVFTAMTHQYVFDYHDGDI